MRAIDSFLVALDNAWSHDWESLMSVVEGVTEEEAAWQAPCYRAEPRRADAPPPGSIRWHVVHIAECKMSYTLRLRGNVEARSPDVPPLGTRTFAGDLAALREAHRAERAAIEAFPDDAFTPTVCDFLANIIRHDIWHGGQIAVARRLFRTRDRD
jgi:uncharacterized damage-inducible protein DinB